MNQSRFHIAAFTFVATVLLLAPPVEAQSGSAPKKDAAPTDRTRQDEGKETLGTFQGAAGHVVRGHVVATTKDSRSVIQFSSDFKTDENKNIAVVLSQEMTYSAKTSLVLGNLAKASGGQDFTLPAGATSDRYKYALLRDRTTGAVVGLAKLPATTNSTIGKSKHDDGGQRKPGGGQ